VRFQLSRAFVWVEHHAIGVAIGAALATIVLGVVLIIGVARINDVPAWWIQAQESMLDKSATRQQAERLENAITTQLTAIRSEDDPRWTAAITAEQANAWLDARLVDTVVTHMGPEAWPRKIERVLLSVEDDQLVLGVRASHQHGVMILWANVELELDAQGELWASLSNIHAGRVWIPIWVLGGLRDQPIARAKIKIGSADFNLGDGRTTKLLGLRMNNGRVELALETTSDLFEHD